MAHLLSFDQFINEALTVATYLEGGKVRKDKHYFERVDTRLGEVKIVGVLDSKKNPVDLEKEKIREAEKFFSGTLPFLAKEILLDEVTIEPDKLGVIRLGIPMIYDGDRKLIPVFDVYVRTHPSTGAKVTTKGTTFWAHTQASVLKTIVCLMQDGSTDESKSKIAEEVGRHMLLPEQDNDRVALERKNKVKLDSPSDFKKVVQFELTPAKIGRLIFNTSEDTDDQINKFIKDHTKPEEATLVFNPGGGLTVEREPVPKQMALIPGQVWWCEPKPDKETWAAQPILESELDRNAIKGNRIKLKLGRKWLHWLPNPMFTPIKKPGQPFVPFAKDVEKGEKVYLAKSTSSGWAIHIGTVTEISQDSRQDYPYVKTEGWDDVIYLTKEESDKIFNVDLEEKRVFSFSEFILKV